MFIYLCIYLFTYLSIISYSSICLFICLFLISLFIHSFIDTVSNSGYTALNDIMLKEGWTEKDMGRNSHHEFRCIFLLKPFTIQHVVPTFHDTCCLSLPSYIYINVVSISSHVTCLFPLLPPTPPTPIFN